MAILAQPPRPVPRPLRKTGWHLVRRVDLARPHLLPYSGRCERCGRGLRYVDILEHAEGDRLAVGRQCSRRLRRGGA